MSYTFSRRNFMKYTALAAAAVAVSGSLTACSNPNQPSGKIGSTLSFGGSGSIFGIGGASDKHTLAAEGTSYTAATGTLTCAFTHKPVSEGTGCSDGHYDLRIVTADGAQYVTAKTAGVNFSCSNGSGSIKTGDEITNVLTISGIADLVDGAKEVYVRYFPRYNALGNEKDSYSDVYAVWDITELFA